MNTTKECPMREACSAIECDFDEKRNMIQKLQKATLKFRNTRPLLAFLCGLFISTKIARINVLIDNRDDESA